MPEAKKAGLVDGDPFHTMTTPFEESAPARQHGSREVKPVQSESLRHIKPAPSGGSKPASTQLRNRQVKQLGSTGQGERLVLPSILVSQPLSTVNVASVKAMKKSAAVVNNGAAPHSQTHPDIRKKIEFWQSKLVAQPDIQKQVAHEIAVQLTHDDEGALAESKQQYNDRLTMSREELQERTKTAVEQQLLKMTKDMAVAQELKTLISDFHQAVLAGDALSELKEGRTKQLTLTCFSNIEQILSDEKAFTAEADSIRKMLSQFEPDNQIVIKGLLMAYQLQ